MAVAELLMVAVMKTQGCDSHQFYDPTFQTCRPYYYPTCSPRPGYCLDEPNVRPNAPFPQQ